MIVYRLCKQTYANDLSGRGAEITGGRWNEKGIPVLYTSGSRALAVLEVAVHVPFGIMPINYCLMAIEAPDASSMIKIKIADLPQDWNDNPLIKETQYIGNNFFKANTHLILQVPSATVPGDFNYLFNPLHADFKLVKILFTEPFEFDSRLFKK
jgi:RES domain-containing protein